MVEAENMLKRVRMFVTDADGTLMGHRPEFDQYRDFRGKINELRNTHGAVWVVCTGRSLRGYKRIFRPMNVFGINPDFVIANHAYIYECKRWGFMPHWIWNLRVLRLQWRERWALRRAIPRLRRAVLSHNPFARLVYCSGDRLSFQFDDDSAANYSAGILREGVRRHKYLQMFETPGEINVRAIPFTKGLAVSELARHLGVSNTQILVVGDGHNDISMIEMTPPCMTACPGNAVVEVIEAVHKTGGHIATGNSLGGVIETLTAYETGRISSELPAGWSGVGSSSKPYPANRTSVFGSLMVVSLGIYTTLLVVGSFCQFPGRTTLMKPYHKLIEMIWSSIGHPGK
jgi:HAD superfamily hydrolase (TIGR01484 family)